MVTQTSVNELLKGVQQLSAEDFDLFFKKISKLQVGKAESSLTKHEQNLLSQIRNILPPDFKKRFFDLVEKRDSRSITEIELAELLDLTGQYEQYDLARLRLMIELANSRGISLPDLVKQFKLCPKENA
jgi:hypothetical protein